MNDSQTPTQKAYVLDLLEIAIHNLLVQIYNLQPEEVNTHIEQEINSIAWIFGHCVLYLDIMNGWYFGERFMNEEMEHHYAYNTPKEKALSQPPLAFNKLVDLSLEIIDKTMSSLAALEEGAFREPPPTKNHARINETLEQFVMRMALHLLGHAGHINLIRQLQGNPGQSFVAGMAKNRRQETQQQWRTWWQTNREQFSNV